MNLLECYIEKVHLEKEVKQDWMDEPYVEVEITTNRCGQRERKKELFPVSYWKTIKEAGFYMA